MGAPSTQSESIYEGTGSQKPIPGALLVFSGNAPMLRAVPISSGPVVFGREEGIELPDEKASRKHAQLVVAQPGQGFRITDFGSRNGTWVDGRRITGEDTVGPRAVVRMAQSIVVMVDDIHRFMGGTVSTDGMVIGPTLRVALDGIVRSARGEGNVLVIGESGAGKELASRAFHDASGQKGRLIAVNCANVEKGVADRLFFGAQKGVGTDVKETSDGYVHAADGGTLFLDELGELGGDVQAKLLRVVENGEVMRVGESTPKKVKVRFIAATHKNLREATATGAFRPDLYFRLGEAEVRLPPLRERREEIPWLIAHALAEEQVRVANATFVEAAMLRHWPGNVRELLAQVKKAAHNAHADASKSVRDNHLDPAAGVSPVASSPGKPTAAAPAGAKKKPSKDEVLGALEASGWVVSKAAKLIGEHRTQFIRYMEQHGIERRGAAAAEDEGPDEG